MIKEQEFFLWIRLIGEIVTRKIKIATKAANPLGEGGRTVSIQFIKTRDNENAFGDNFGNGTYLIMQ